MGAMRASRDEEGSALGAAPPASRQRASKKRITLFLDADVLAWLRQERGYQRWINRALRELMLRENGEASGRLSVEK